MEAQASRPAAPAVSSLVLENGLTVIVLEEPNLDWVSVRYTFRRGAEDGSSAQLGLSTLALRLAMAEQAQNAVSRHGAFDSSRQPLVYGYVDRSAGHAVTSASVEQIDRTLAALAERLKTPQVSTESVRSAALMQLSEMQRDAHDPLALARNHARQILHGAEHPLGHSQSGRLSELAKLTFDEIEAHHHFMFAPNTSALIVAGGASASEAQELANRHFGTLPRSAHRHLRSGAGDDTAGKGARAILAPGSTAHLVQAFSAPARWTGDRVSFEALSLIAGELYSSRINLALRERVSYTYAVRASHEPSRAGDALLLETAIDPADVADALQIVDQELARLREEEVQPQELARAKTQLRERRAARLEDPEQASLVLAENFIARLPDSSLSVQQELDEYYAAVERLSATDIGEVAERYLSSEYHAVVVAGPLTDVTHELRQWSPEIEFFFPAAADEHVELMWW